MNSPYSRIKHAYWLLRQLKRLHHRYRLRKMILMSIPVMLIVFTYLGIQFKDLYQLKYLQLSEQQAENVQKEDQFEKIEAPEFNLASNSASLESPSEDNSEFGYLEEGASFSTEIDHELLADANASQTTEEVYQQSFEEIEVTEDEFIAGLTARKLELEILRIDESKLAYLASSSNSIHIPAASPSLLKFKPVPYVRIPSADLFTEAELEEQPSDSFLEEGEDQ